MYTDSVPGDQEPYDERRWSTYISNKDTRVLKYPDPEGDYQGGTCSTELLDLSSRNMSINFSLVNLTFSSTFVLHHLHFLHLVVTDSGLLRAYLWSKV